LLIPQKNLKRWCEIGSKRKGGGGRKTLDLQMEENLKAFIMNQYKN